MHLKFKVYRITNILNRKCYIGITSRRMCDRWEEHVANSRGKRKRHSKLYDAIAKYGAASFRKEIIDSTDNEDAVRALEVRYIAEHNSFEAGYNSNPGGNGFLHFPDHIRKKISEAQKGRVNSASTRAKMSLAKIGDKRCAAHFGDHTKKGAGNPRAKSYLIQFPDGTQRIVTGLRAFGRENNITTCKLIKNGKTKGYVLLKRFIDYPEREYTQAGGSGENPNALAA
jgi:group I intron endonuclease